MNRRDFLGVSLGALVFPHAALAQSSSYRRLLILIELKGGNDGLNTVVPHTDDQYYRLRPRLALREVLPLDSGTGLHPALNPLLPLWQARELAIVQGVGYPRPNLSHFRSIEIWDTASKSEQYLTEGWLVRAFAGRPVPREFAADGVAVGGNEMGPLAGSGVRAIALDDPAAFLRRARLASPTRKGYNSALNHILRVEADIAQAASRLHGGKTFATEFPRGAFGNAVRVAAQLAANPAGVAAIRLSLGGFDTHQNQLAIHQRLLGELAEGLVALKNALVEAGRWDSTLVMSYAEFGRRPQENNSNGTDHGTAAAHFFAGGRVKGGLYGEAPRLDELDNGNLRHSVDFRSLYATALERWWGLPSTAVLNGRFAPLDVLRA